MMGWRRLAFQAQLSGLTMHQPGSRLQSPLYQKLAIRIQTGIVILLKTAGHVHRNMTLSGRISFAPEVRR